MRSFLRDERLGTATAADLTASATLERMRAGLMLLDDAVVALADAIVPVDVIEPGLTLNVIAESSVIDNVA